MHLSFVYPRIRSSTGFPGVEIRALVVPGLVRVGENVTLTCDFRMLGEDQKLYTVNWWRDNDQFFTFSQEKHNNRSSYDFDGITVDVSVRLWCRQRLIQFN